MVKPRLLRVSITLLEAGYVATASLTSLLTRKLKAKSLEATSRPRFVLLSSTLWVVLSINLICPAVVPVPVPVGFTPEPLNK